MNHSRLAKELFEKGCNCSQAVFAAFCDETGIDFDTALRLSSSFGGGMGRLREVCGALSGAFLVLGALYGYTDTENLEEKAAHYRLIQDFAARFKEKHGSILCRTLLGIADEKSSPNPDKRTKEYYQSRPCSDLVEDAARMLDDYIQNERLGGTDMIKIAVASEKDIVTGHFGHCENFNIYTAENGNIIKFESIANPGHKPGFLPNFLNDLGVDVIISGGMGGGAVDIFTEKGIKVILGAEGSAKDAARAYLSGELRSTGDACKEHSKEH